MPNFSSRYRSAYASDHPPAHNPEEFEGDTVTLYRGQGGDGETLGIHWTTDPTMMIEHGGYTVHRVDAPRSAILPRKEWFDRGVSEKRELTDSLRRQGVAEWSPTQWGLDIEQEVRLRPGAVVSNHATGEYQPDTYDYKWTSTGRSPVIDVGPGDKYKNLAHSAVQGTPQAESLHRYQQSLPHVQPALPFVEKEFYDPITNKGMGLLPAIDDDDYVKKWDIKEHSIENELIAKHGKMVDVEIRHLGETVPMSNLTNHMGPQFEQPKQPAPVDPNQLEIPGTKSAWELWSMRNE